MPSHQDPQSSSRPGPKLLPTSTGQRFRRDLVVAPSPCSSALCTRLRSPSRSSWLACFPDADDETRKVALSNMIRSEGSRKAGLALLQDVYNKLNTYPVEGAKLPRLASLSGPLILARTPFFITRTYPAEVQAGSHHFSGPLYIGRAGQDGVRLSQDWSQQNVVFSIQSGRGMWANISTWVVLQRSMIESHIPTVVVVLPGGARIPRRPSRNTHRFSSA
ncbi:hypothetical protein B0H14DRAFT_2727397, partial [Mycena olivaceomarginata]